MSRMLDVVCSYSAMLGIDTEVTRAREHRPLSRGSSDGPQPYQGRPSVGPVPPSRCGPATLFFAGLLSWCCASASPPHAVGRVHAPGYGVVVRHAAWVGAR